MKIPINHDAEKRNDEFSALLKDFVPPSDLTHDAHSRKVPERIFVHPIFADLKNNISEAVEIGLQEGLSYPTDYFMIAREAGTVEKKINLMLKFSIEGMTQKKIEEEVDKNTQLRSKQKESDASIKEQEQEIKKLSPQLKRIETAQEDLAKLTEEREQIEKEMKPYQKTVKSVERLLKLRERQKNSAAPQDGEKAEAERKELEKLEKSWNLTPDWRLVKLQERVGPLTREESEEYQHLIQAQEFQEKTFTATYTSTSKELLQYQKTLAEVKEKIDAQKKVLAEQEKEYAALPEEIKTDIDCRKAYIDHELGKRGKIQYSTLANIVAPFREKDFLAEQAQIINNYNLGDDYSLYTPSGVIGSMNAAVRKSAEGLEGSITIVDPAYPLRAVTQGERTLLTIPQGLMIREQVDIGRSVKNRLEGGEDIFFRTAGLSQGVELPPGRNTLDIALHDAAVDFTGLALRPNDQLDFTIKGSGEVKLAGNSAKGNVGGNNPTNAFSIKIGAPAETRGEQMPVIITLPNNTRITPEMVKMNEFSGLELNLQGKVFIPPEDKQPVSLRFGEGQEPIPLRINGKFQFKDEADLILKIEDERKKLPADRMKTDIFPAQGPQAEPPLPPGIPMPRRPSLGKE